MQQETHLLWNNEQEFLVMRKMLMCLHKIAQMKEAPKNADD
jgi:hypothetical protein